MNDTYNQYVRYTPYCKIELSCLRHMCYLSICNKKGFFQSVPYIFFTPGIDIIGNILKIYIEKIHEQYDKISNFIKNNAGRTFNYSEVDSMKTIGCEGFIL